MDPREPTDDELRARGRVVSVVVVAARKCGKTTFARSVVRATVPQTDWLISDPEAEHWPRMYGGRATILQTVQEFRALKRPRPGWAYIFRAEDGESVAAVALEMEHCAVLFDEADKDVGKDRKVDRGSARWRLANRNAQHFVGVYWLFRRMSDVWLTLPNNCNHAVIGYTQGRDDLKRVGEEFSEDAQRLVSELPDPQSDPAGVWMVTVKLHGRKVARKVFIPHQ
jgi:hypothetical protein